MTQRRRMILPHPHQLWLYDIERWGARVLGMELGALAWKERWLKQRQERLKNVR